MSDSTENTNKSIENKEESENKSEQKDSINVYVTDEKIIVSLEMAFM